MNRMSGLQDLRYALRMVAKNPWFSAAIVVTLALGIGVNTTVFSLVYAVLQKPLPFPGGDRMVMVHATNSTQSRDFQGMSPADYRDLQNTTDAFERIEGFNRFPATISERGNPPERFGAAMVTTGLFDMLQVKPVLGRGFEAADSKPGAAPVILLGYGAWKSRYGSDRSVIGRSVRMNDKSATIVGVMPEGFRFPNNEDLWTAAIEDGEFTKRDNRALVLVALRKPGVSIEEAQAQVSVLAARLSSQFPASHKDTGMRVQTFHNVMNGGPIRLVFLLLLGAVGFVLLIACANVANLMLSRAVERTREISIRSAMGASRWRLVRQLLVESLVFSICGGLLGLGLAELGIRAFGAAVENVGKPYWINFAMDYAVFGYFAAIILLAGLIFGLAPAISALRVDVNEYLKEGAKSSGSRGAGWVSSALVVFQFALAVILLSGAGLMMRSFVAAQNEFAGVRADRVLLSFIGLPRERYETPEKRQRFYEELMAKAAGIPGVQTVSMVSNVPGQGAAGWRFEIAGQPVPEAQRRPAALGIVAAPGYFQLLGMKLIRGRDFTAADGAPGREAAIVSQQFAARYFGNQDPIGKQIRVHINDKEVRPWMTIVGISPNLRQRNPTDEGNDHLIFVPHRQESYSGMAVLLRTSGDPAAIGPAVRREVQAMDDELPIANLIPLEDQFRRARWHLRVFGSVFLIFAAIAMGMAAIGSYAVLANATARRTREIGIRMALGAGSSNILQLVIRRGLLQTGLGLIIGMTAGLLLTRLMAQILFGVPPHDPVTFGGVALVLLVAGLLATWMPAQRASRLDPVRALRHD